MVGYYDRQGKLCTLVKELNRTFIVDRSPLQILNDSIRCIGFDLRGAMETAKWLLGNKYMRPVMVNPVYRICVFPDKSSKNPCAMWFNPCHIARTKSFNQRTQIGFTNGLSITHPLSLNTFNQKLQIADQFRKLISKMDTDPFSFKEDPKKGA